MHPLKIQDWFDSREQARTHFLRGAGWGEARLSPIGEDCAFRRYFRLSGAGKTAVLMESVPDHEDIATPGHRLGDFVRIGKIMRECGLNTPEIYALDERSGYVLMRDFGDLSFKAALQQGDKTEDLYALATDILSYMRENIAEAAIILPHYYNSHVHDARRRIVDWFIPALRGERNADGLAESYLAVWDEIEKSLPACAQGFLHIDYHLENLMWLPDEQGLQQCGILDFQGAMWGPVPYDLANLLEDARQEICPHLRRNMLDHFCEGMSKEEKALFQSWYRVLATQFHCRVAGQFIRLAVRDGKARYLQHLPRVTGYLRAGLEHPVLKPMRQWFAGQGIDFKTIPVIEPDTVRPLIRDDAY